MPDAQPPLPPLPPARDALTFSEMVPFRSTKIRLWKSPLLVLGLVTAVVVVMLFASMDGIFGDTAGQQKFDAIVSEINLLVGYILFLIGWAIHVYTRSHRTVLFYVFPALCCWLMLQQAPFTLLELVFRKTLPGDVFALPPDVGIARIFVAHFFGAGLMEEFLKATGILIAFAFTLRAARLRPGMVPPRLAELLTLRGPLDGVLMGVAAGAVFVFVETSGTYGLGKFFEFMEMSKNDLFFSWSATLSLILPRTFGGITGPGHISYSAVFGYFIGLAVIRPAAAPKLVLGGWLAATVLHTVWNTLGSVRDLPALVQYVWGAVTVAFFLACLLKARQIEAVMRGGPADTGGSIIVGDAPAAAARTPAPAIVPPARVAPAGPRQLSLVVAGQRMPLAAGARIDLPPLGGVSGAGGPATAEVSSHPNNPEVLGLKNTGAAPWSATLADGRVQEVAAGKNVRLSPGVRIDFGAGLIGLVAAV